MSGEVTVASLSEYDPLVRGMPHWGEENALLGRGECRIWG